MSEFLKRSVSSKKIDRDGLRVGKQLETDGSLVAHEKFLVLNIECKAENGSGYLKNCGYYALWWSREQFDELEM